MKPGSDKGEGVSKSKKEQTFEEALTELEAIIENLETGEVPLAELVEKYENGTKLLKTCHDRLNEAELKIEKLREKSDQPVFDNFDPDD
ncbi:MAG: exodeoxyribonuclease VII small subunit [Verrucomicrobiae bacterium]|nr:exodeoxyribonuclease VII small subunit [Verrucomicrobiae bacterium]